MLALWIMQLEMSSHVLFSIEQLAATRKNAFDAPWRRLQDRSLRYRGALQGEVWGGSGLVHCHHCRWASRECREVDKLSDGDDKNSGKEEK